MSNVVKITQTGTVSVEVRCENADKHEARLAFAVKDTEIGIPPDKLPYLFREFSQVDSSISRGFGGTGLGLAICKRLVSGMHGTIGVESEPIMGSTFHFTACSSILSSFASPARCSTRSGRQSHRGRRGEMLPRSATAFSRAARSSLSGTACACFGEVSCSEKVAGCGSKVVVLRLSVVFRARYSPLGSATHDSEKLPEPFVERVPPVSYLAYGTCYSSEAANASSTVGQGARLTMAPARSLLVWS